MRKGPRALAFTAAILCAAALAPAQGWAQDDEDPVEVSFEVTPASAAPGATVEVRAKVTIDEGWHVYSTTETQGIPSKLEVTPGAGFSLSGGVREPAFVTEEMPFIGSVQIHKGTFTFAQRVKLAADASGEVKIPVAFHYQTCSEGENAVCLPEADASQVLSLTVDGGAPSDGTLPFVPPFGDPSGEEVKAVASLSHVTVPPGSLVELRLDVTIKDTWYIYATSTPAGLATKLALQLPDGLTAVGALEEPEPKVKEIENFGKTRSHLGPSVRFVQPVKVADSASGSLALKGSLEWQACDPATCVNGSQEFDLALAVSPDAPPTGVVRDPSTAPQAPQAAGEDIQSRPVALMGASIVLGLLMLLMPCTYPMIPITISIFSKGKSLSRGASIWRASVYGAGIVFSFMVIAGLVQVIFGGQGQGKINEFAVNAWVNLLIGIVFVYFAGSFFGYYELGIPAPIQRLMQLGAAKTDKTGMVPTWSLFTMGLFFVLTTYACGAPVVLGLFATAAQDPHPAAILFATFIFSLTVALPFFVLALIPSGIRLLPKSGSWFSVFKVALAFVELGFAIKFFRGVDLQWEWINLLTRPVTLGLWVALCVATTVYLFGFFPLKFPHDPDLRARSFRRYAWAGLFVLLAGYFGYGMAGNQLAADVEAFILPDPEVSEEGVHYGNLLYKTDLASLEEAKQWAKDEGRPAFLMFTGHFCVNCVAMEKGVLELESVTERIKDVPRVSLYIDKPGEEPHRELMLKRYNKAGTIPAFYLIDSQGDIKSAQVGNCPTATFLEFLDRGGLPAP